MTMSDAQRRRSARAAARLRRLLRRECELWDQGMVLVAGVDEAGVGPLAGPVVAAAVVFPSRQGVKGVDDSKRVSPERRLELAEVIRRKAAYYHVAQVSPQEIDAINIYQAGLVAMRKLVLLCPWRSRTSLCMAPIRIHRSTVFLRRQGLARGTARVRLRAG